MDSNTHAHTQTSVCKARGCFPQFLFATLGVFHVVVEPLGRRRGLINTLSLRWQTLKAPLNPSEVRDEKSVCMKKVEVYWKECNRVP